MFEDGSEQVLRGCDSCGRKFFFYIRKEQIEKIKRQEETEVEFFGEDKKQVEKDVREIAGIVDEEIPVFLDFESIKVIKPGKYAVDLANLFALDKPRIYKLEDGKYIIDLSVRLKKAQA